MTTPSSLSDGAPTKCPCCNNPWASGEFMKAMMCGECRTNNKSEDNKTTGVVPAALDRANLNESVSPSQNFFVYANGGWQEKNPIPSGYPNWNSFLQLHVQSQERCQKLLENLQQQTSKGSSSSSTESSTDDANKLATFYTAAMREDVIEEAGLKPLQPVLDAIEKVVEAHEDKDSKEYARLLGQLDAKFGLSNPFFTLYASPDGKNADWTIAQICQAGLGMSDRDYYFDDDKQDKRDAYVEYVARMLTLLLEKNAEASEDAAEPSEYTKSMAQRIMDMETQLAKSHMTRTENRDPIDTYNKMSVNDLLTLTDNHFPFDEYFCGLDKNKEMGDINVRNKAALQTTAQVAVSIESDVLRAYLQKEALTAFAPYMSKVFVNTHFDFYEKTMSGTQEIKPRWKRAMAFVEDALGEALGQLYCQEFFDETSKTKALDIVEQVRQALEKRLKEVEWMLDDSTREQALKKMSRFRVKIGYPNKWIDYSTLQFEQDDSFLSMVFKARAFHRRRTMTDINAATDREKWFMTPQTVNAYYHPSLNEIVFPAAILQHPFFDATADDAFNFGAMGAVVGHEMTHGFDDKGRKYNWQGQLEDWWTERDATEYEKRVEVMVEQANAFQVHEASVQGNLTKGENIADLGGLSLSLSALKAQANFDATAKLDGFTPIQRFFLSWAQCWRQNITKERSLQLVTMDPHGPNEMRCNCPLSNMPDFHQAFDIPEDSPMFKPVENRVDIW